MPFKSFKGKRAAWLFFALLLAGCSPTRSRFAWQLAMDLNRIRQEESFAFQGRVLGPIPLILSENEKKVRFDLYRPVRGDPQVSVLAVPGAAEEGKDDPRLVAFAKVLAANGFLVAVPDLQGIKTLRVGPGDIQEIKEGFRLFASHPGLSPKGRSGMIAFSYAAGPTLLASLQPEIKDQVRFLVLVGGYYDVERVLHFTTTGYHEYKARREKAAPHPYGKLVFLLAVEDLMEPADRKLLREMVEKVLKDPQADLDPLAQTLGSEGKKIYGLLVNQDPQRFASLFAGLYPQMRQRLKILSPSSYDLSRLRARVYLIHGRWDPAIPYTESLRLRDALRPHVPVHLAILQTLYHVELGFQRGLLEDHLDRWKIFLSLYHIARETAL